MSKPSKLKSLVVLGLVFVIGAGVGVVVAKRGVPLVGTSSEWGIGIFQSSDPTKPFTAGNIKNPVLTIKDVTDMDAEFVADPFMVKDKDTWYLFVEVLNRKDDKGDLSVATSKDGKTFKYQKLVLDEKFHLSYPHVFKADGKWYMIPETWEDRSIRLYEATQFPYKWKFVKKLLKGAPYLDTNVIKHNGKWWMWTCIVTNNVTMLYYADTIHGPWTSHPKNPLTLGDARISRGGGNIVKHNGMLIRYVQDDSSSYGNAVRAVKVTTLTTTDYAQTVVETPVVKPTGSGWNALGMHQVDAHKIGPGKWIAAVDGYYEARRYGLKH